MVGYRVVVRQGNIVWEGTVVDVDDYEGYVVDWAGLWTEIVPFEDVEHIYEPWPEEEDEDEGE